MLFIIVIYLWDFIIILTSAVAGQQHIQSQTFDITIGNCTQRAIVDSWRIINLNLLFCYLGGVFTDRDEGTESQSMENIFKYAIFHYNRLAKEAHNLSFKIRLKEETLNLIAADSAVQTVHDGLTKLIC